MPGLLALLLACGPPDGVTAVAGSTAPWAPLPGAELEFVPQGAPEAPALLLRVGEGWSLRQGERWADATVVGDYPAAFDEGLWVGTQQLLPAQAAVGSQGEGVEITAAGPSEVWYGAFPDTLTATVQGTPFGGDLVFARDVGPILLGLSGQVWELATYTPGSAE